MNTGCDIREYHDPDEVEWLRCRVIAFLETPYFDDVCTEKPRYERPSIELVATQGASVVGLIDVELDVAGSPVCSIGPGLGGMVWNLAVHPDHRRQGIANELLRAAGAIARRSSIERLEAWTRDDPGTHAWYRAQGFREMERYLHVYIDADEALLSPVAGIRPRMMFGHFVGSDAERAVVMAQYRRVYECVRFDLALEE